MARRVAIGLLLLVLTGCSPREQTLVDARLYAMATSIDVTLPAAAARDNPNLLATIEADLRRFELDYYPWADGELSRLNRALSAGEPFRASPQMAAVLATARGIAIATDGAYDPGIGPLVELWGFNDGSAETAAAVPDADAIAAVLAATGSILDLDIGGTTIAAPPASYLLDLGGIAKGVAVDRIVAELEAAGIGRALVNAGGDLRSIGEPVGRRWRIGIQAPRADGLLGTIELRAGEAAFSSGDYERFFERDDERFHHILDPRTGRPVAHTAAVTVIAPDGTLADAAATALFVAGPAEWRVMAARLGIDAALRVDAGGEVEMTPAMRDRFRAVSAAASDIIAAGD